MCVTFRNSKQYSLLVKNLRMATKYSFHVKPQTKKSDQRASGRADEGGQEQEEQNASSTAAGHNQGQTIIIPTKGCKCCVSYTLHRSFR